MRVALPLAVATGERITVKNYSASTNAITIDAGVGVIDGASTYVINTAWGCAVFVDVAPGKWAKI